MSIYDFESLMTQTRRLASQYRESTGQSLPVTVELARFDAITLLGLKESDPSVCEGLRVEDGVKKLIQIKGRVIYPGGKSRQRVGQLNIKAPWDYTALVIYNPDYLPVAIYEASREVLEPIIAESEGNKRGAMTVAKFKAIGELIWQAPESQNPESLSNS